MIYPQRAAWWTVPLIEPILGRLLLANKPTYNRNQQLKRHALQRMFALGRKWTY